jgi:hypothetical protein
MFCKAKKCRFHNTHVTLAHTCGLCKGIGHGILECNHPELIDELHKDNTKIPFELYCCVVNCSSTYTHTTEGHCCLYCGKYSHDAEECPERLWKVKVERSTIFTQIESGYKEKKYLQIMARNQMKWEEHMVYTKVYGGMGCIWFARRKNNFEKIELFFMHTDNWGQYGSTTDHRPILDKFLEGYRSVDKE